MKTSRKIFIALFCLLALATLIVCSGTLIDAGSFDPFSALMCAGSVKAGLFFMGINMTDMGQPDDITFVEGTENMGGFGMTAYLGLRSHIVTYPVLDTSDTSLDNLVKLIGDYVFASNRNFMTIDFVPDTLKVTPESQGEHVGGKSFNIKGEGFVAGTSTKNRGLARLLNNSFGILILIRDDGSRLALGSYQRPLSFTASVDEGQKAPDKKGVLITFDTSSFVPGYEYYGAIPLSGSTLPAVSS